MEKSTGNGSSSASRPRCVLIGGNSSSRTTIESNARAFRESDAVLVQMLESQGFSVQLIDQLNVQPTDPVIPRADVVVVSGTVTNGEMQQALKDLPVGIVCMNRGWWKHLGLTKTVGTWTHGKTADWVLSPKKKNILNLWGAEKEHTLEIYNKVLPIYSTGRRSLSPDAVPLLGHSHGIYMFYLESGSLLCDGSLAAAKRVGMFIHCSSADQITLATKDLFLRAVCWACNWSPRIIPVFPEAFKKAVKTILLMHQRHSSSAADSYPGSPRESRTTDLSSGVVLEESPFSMLPIELVYHIIRFLV